MRWFDFFCSFRETLGYLSWSWGVGVMPASDPPSMAHFWDNRMYPSTTRVRRTLDFWRRWPLTRLESNAVYSVYDKGDIVDVGAAEGWYAILFAPKLKGKMLLFEPDKKRIPELQSNLNSLIRTWPEKDFILMPFACSDNPKVPMAQNDAGQFSVAESPNQNPSFAAVSLDQIVELFQLRPSFIKIDVEGHEMNVLRSGQKLLRNLQPILMVEMHGIELQQQVRNFLSALAYKEETIFEDGGILRSLFKKN
jgi:FkbM family methyltransferase